MQALQTFFGIGSIYKRFDSSPPCCCPSKPPASRVAARKRVAGLLSRDPSPPQVTERKVLGAAAEATAETRGLLKRRGYMIARVVVEATRLPSAAVWTAAASRLLGRSGTSGCRIGGLPSGSVDSGGEEASRWWWH
ncbi:hypothetical protein E2562_008768 [Oryza meyeriana var. granulata]|uniref:Uncharacterized protein n=1 Tax=Oryza meyeriana var. granulata TaxID=110450 RepID=A0A6G1CZ09_9ORYZ|nr:hypothetical protein E2562_008768 [Oryza meyeriana var. granulata]